MINLQALVTAKEAEDDAATGAQIVALTAAVAERDEEIADLVAQIEAGGTGDSTPDAFTFTAVADAQPGQVYISNEITIAGINEAVVATSTVPRSKNGGAFAMTEGVSVNGDKFRLQLTSSLSPNVNASGSLTVGGVSADFSITTADNLTPADMFPQQVHRAWFQEDIAEGEVASWPARGRSAVAAAQTTVVNRPVKLSANGGVYFEKGLPKRLQWAQDNEAAYSHRWWVVIAKTDTTSAVADGLVVAINGNSGSNTNRQPIVWFNKADNTFISAVADATGHALRGPVMDSGWQVLFGYRRGTTMHAYVNGVYVGSHDFTSFRVPNISTSCFMGAVSGNMGADVWIDAVVFGDGELTDDQKDCMLGWAHHRAGRQDMLDAGFPFKSDPPRAADKPPLHAVHEHDPTEWTNWVSAKNAMVDSHRGEQTYSETGYVTVFKTDFDRADQLPANDLVGHKNSPWFTPYWNDARPESARWRETTGIAPPEAYLLDTTGSGTLALRLINNGGVWKIGAMCSVLNNGAGRTWGKGIFKLRFKYNPVLTPPYPGIFDAFWSYGHEHLTQRTRNRTEQDWMENTGKDHAWVDANLHIHKGKFPFAADPTIITGSDVNSRFGDRQLDAPFPAPFNMFDGEWHEIVVKVDDDLTYLYAGVNGVLYESARVPTVSALSMLKYLIVDRANSATHGNRSLVTTEVIDYVIDYVEVMQKESDLAVVPAGFSALPTISASGLTLTVTPNTVGSQIEYRYYADGVPIVLADGPNPTLAAEWAGKSIRCHVKNMSLVNQPEAWTVS